MKLLAFLCTLLVVVGCGKPEPRPISYNTDQCSACKMNITDQRFGAEAVLSTGKHFVFDAPECMLDWYVAGADGLRDKIHSMYVTDYANPGTLILAEQASYVHGEHWTSPMGLDVAAFASKEVRDEQIAQHGGKPLTYSEVVHMVETE